jgi:hypothetical protein
MCIQTPAGELHHKVVSAAFVQDLLDLPVCRR